MQQTNNKVIVSNKTIIIRHQLVYSGKNAVVVTPVTSEGLEELIRFREQEKENRLQKLAEKTVEGITQWNNKMPWEQEQANQYSQSIN